MRADPMAYSPASFPTMDRELVAASAGLPAVDLTDLAGARRAISTGAEAARSGLADLAETWATDIEESAAPGGDRLTFRPRRLGAGPAPVLLWIHGGGFVIGSPLLEAAFCAEVAERTGTVVVALGYRLAPEHPYPAGLYDCYAELRSLWEGADRLGLDRARFGVAGQSAGGCLAVATALLARDRGEIDLRFLAAESPVLDDRMTTGSMQAFTDTPVWRRSLAELSWRHYLGPATEVPAYAAPARSTDLAGLPRAHLTAAELDPLRDECIRFATALMHAGVSVELHTYPGTFHRSSILTTAAVSRRQRADFVAAVTAGLSTEVEEGRAR
jgi:acetyl esterase